MPTVAAAAGTTVTPPDPARYTRAGTSGVGTSGVGTSAEAAAAAALNNALSGTGTTAGSGAGAAASSSSKNNNTLDKDAFLKLLVAQLKYQDPMQPSSSEEFIATTAQFTMVEKLDQLTQQGTATALVSSLSTASALVGRTISAIQNGAGVDATVLKSKIVSGEVVLDTDKGVIHLNEIASVGPLAGATGAPAAPAGAQTQTQTSATGSQPAAANPPVPASDDAGLAAPDLSDDPTIDPEENQR